LVTITRRLAQQLRTVLRRAFGNIRGEGPAIGFIAGVEGLIVRSTYGDIAIECRLPGERTTETLWLPFDFLADVAGKNDEPVELEATGDGQISVQLRTGNVPHAVTYDAVVPFEADKFPVLPKAFTANVGLLQALHEASEVTDSDSSRFAVSCLQLCPDGTINATDGRQMLSQSGFNFPWQESILVPRNKVFASPELPQNKPAAIAQSGEWAVLSAGRWTVYLRINTGSYPDVSRHIPNPESAKARCQLSKDDIRFLIETLPQLPCNDEVNSPVTIDLNGHVAIRAKAADQIKPTEVILTNSQWTGEPVRININRKYLARAIRLGLNDLSLYGEESALLCQGFGRKMVWMPLDKGSALPPAEDVIRIESPTGEIAAPIPQLVTPREVPTMTEPTIATNGNTTSNGQAKTDTTNPKAFRRKVALQDIAALIEDAEKLRTAAHNLMCQASGVVKGLKQHRRQNRAVQQTIAQLRTLKSLGV